MDREYTFSVRESGEPREFTLAIANEAFVSHRARFQDGPSICALRLHIELETFANHPPEAHYRLANTEPAAYSESQLSEKPRKLHRPMPKTVTRVYDLSAHFTRFQGRSLRKQKRGTATI
jgi:hypothetical protein